MKNILKKENYFEKGKNFLLTFLHFPFVCLFGIPFFFTYRQCLSSSSTLSSTLPNHKLPTLNTSLPENVTTTELHSFLQKNFNTAHNVWMAVRTELKAANRQLHNHLMEAKNDAADAGIP